MKSTFEIHPVGIIRKDDAGCRIDIFPQFRDGLLGLDGFSHLQVMYWFHENDTPEKRNTLRVHPRKNPRNPLTGVFATHSPARPNLIAMSYCRNLGVDAERIRIDRIDAFDGSPVVDIKPYIPVDLLSEPVVVPDWV